MEGIVGPEVLIVAPELEGAPLKLRGCGVLLDRKLVITVARLLGDSTDISVRIRGMDRFLGCDVVFKDEQVAVLMIKENLPEAVTSASVSFGRISESDSPRKAYFIFFETSFESDGKPAPVRVTGKLDPVAAPGCYAFYVDKQLSKMYGVGGAGVMCDGHLMGLAFRGSENALTIRSMADILQSKPVRSVIEQHTDLLTKTELLEPVELNARTAINEVSAADPTNIQQVAAGTFALNNLYYENVLSQAKSSYKAAVITATIASALFLLAIVLGITVSRIAPSTLSTIGGAIVAAISGLNFWLYGQTSKQLDSFHIRLEQMQRHLVANSVSSSMTEPNRNQGLLAIIGSLCGEVKKAG